MLGLATAAPPIPSGLPLLMWLLVAVPLAGGALLVVAGFGACPGVGGRPRSVDRLAAPAGVLLAGVVLGLGVAAALLRPAAQAPLLAGLGVGLAVDGLSAVLVVTVAVAALAVVVFAAGEAKLRSARFVGLILVFAGAMLVTVTATGLVPLLMAWEVMGATSWALIAYHYRDPAAAGAGNTAFLTTRTADVGLYLAAGAALAGGVGGLTLAGLPTASGGWLHLLCAGVVLAALGKSAQLPFSFWLSGAMRGPSPVSALLHSATMVAAGAYLLLRLSPLLAATGWAGPLVAWVGVATAMLLGLVALAQTDLKQLLAASTCAQIGYMIMAAGLAGTSTTTATVGPDGGMGVGGGVVQLVAHAATKALLFLAAGAWLAALGTKSLDGLRGAARRFPLVGVVFTLGALSLAGLPPLSLWVGKDSVLAAAVAVSPALYVAGLVAAVVAGLYSGVALWYVWAPVPTAPAAGVEQDPTGRVTAPMRPPLIVLAGLAAVLGVLPMLGLDAFTPDPAPAAWELALSGVIALAATGVAWRLGERVPRPRALRSWLSLERSAHTLVVGPTLAVAAALARFDDRVLARGVDGAAMATVRASRLLDRRGEVSVDGVVRAVVAGARSLGRWARRPQTGQLHQYYAQTSVGFAVLAGLAVLVIVMR